MFDLVLIGASGAISLLYLIQIERERKRKVSLFLLCYVLHDSPTNEKIMQIIYNHSSFKEADDELYRCSSFPFLANAAASQSKPVHLFE